MRLSSRLFAVPLVWVCGSAFAGEPHVNRFAGGEASRFASVYWFRTGRGSVLVDAPLLLPEGEKLKVEMTSAGALPLGAVLLTSGRPERSWGLGPLLSAGTRVWASRATATALERRFGVERDGLLRSGLPFAWMPRTPPRVTNTFTGSLNLGFEGYTLRLLEVGEAGAPRTTTVFVPETGELFAGDLVWNRLHPATRGADLGAWRRALQDLGRLRPRVVYPGHGPPGGPELLVAMVGYLGDLEEAVRPLALRPSLSVRDVAALRKTVARKHRDWLLPDALDESLRAEHVRLHILLAGGG